MKIVQYSLLALALIALGGCNSVGGGHNPTTYQPTYNSDVAKTLTNKKVVLATANFQKPSRSVLTDYEIMIDRHVTDYLESHGYEVLPRYIYENAWATALRKTGKTFDPTTGALDQDAQNLALSYAIQQVAEESDASLIVYTDLLLRKTSFNVGMSHNAQWDGVTRRLPKQGTGDGIPVDFDWNDQVDVASLWVNVFSTKDLKLVFSGLGGIDSLEAINMKASEPRFSRKRSLFTNEEFIEEGIQLAFHPLIKMSGWPGKAN